MRYLKLIALTIGLLFLSSSPGVIKTAEARCCLCCPQGVLSGYHSTTRSVVNGAVDAMFSALTDTLLTDVWWSAGVRPLVLQMANELTAGGWTLVGAIGAQLDGRVVRKRSLLLKFCKVKLLNAICLLSLCVNLPA